MSPITHLLEQLPKSAQQQVRDFIEFLLAKYPAQRGANQAAEREKYPLRGSVQFYEDPFGPAVSEEDWDTLK